MDGLVSPSSSLLRGSAHDVNQLCRDSQGEPMRSERSLPHVVVHAEVKAQDSARQVTNSNDSRDKARVNTHFIQQTCHLLRIAMGNPNPILSKKPSRSQSSAAAPAAWTPHERCKRCHACYSASLPSLIFLLGCLGDFSPSVGLARALDEWSGMLLSLKGATLPTALRNPACAPTFPTASAQNPSWAAKPSRQTSSWCNSSSSATASSKPCSKAAPPNSVQAPSSLARFLQEARRKLSALQQGHQDAASQPQCETSSHASSEGPIANDTDQEEAEEFVPALPPHLA